MAKSQRNMDMLIFINKVDNLFTSLAMKYFVETHIPKLKILDLSTYFHLSR
jgi:hypothetical protein